MKKTEIERMQRLEEIIERQKHQISGQELFIEKLQQEGLKLQGANEALTNLVKQGFKADTPITPIFEHPLEMDVPMILRAKELRQGGETIEAIKLVRRAFHNTITLSLRSSKALVETWEILK